MADEWTIGKTYAREAEDGKWKLVTCITSHDADEPAFSEWVNIDGSPLRFPTIEDAKAEVIRRRTEAIAVEQQARSVALSRDIEL